MNLYPYQQTAVENAVQMIFERGNSLIVAGTGAGKTIMMAAAIGNYITAFRAVNGRYPHVLVLVHRTEIHTQNHSKFSLVNPNIPISEITQARKSLHGYVHFGMVQTVANIMPELAKAKSFFDLIVIDEAHHAKASTYENIIEQNKEGNPNAALLGVTATPNRGDKMPLIDLFDNYYQITTKFLIDSHYLVRPTFIDMSPTFDTGKEIEKGHLAKNCRDDMQGNAIIEKLVDDFLNRKQDGKSVIFTPSHDFCVKVYDILKSRGRNPAYLSLGLDDASRKLELEKFEKGDCGELINVDICTEGYDYPPLRNIVDFDTNGTHGQWVQKVGRVIRACPGKTSCTVLDFGGNIEAYPQGIETEVNLNGAVRKGKGQKLKEDDFFRETVEKSTAEVIAYESERYTPYHLPKGFETVNDKEYGIVYAACGKEADCIITVKNDICMLFKSDKKHMFQIGSGEFDAVMREAEKLIGDTEETADPITKLQIKLLAPEYPTMTLTKHGANCVICWKVWKNDITKMTEAMQNGKSNDI